MAKAPKDKPKSRRGGARPNSGGARKNSGGRREGAGRKPWSPTKEQRGVVQTLSATGYTQEYIAERLGVDDQTLRKHCSHELKYAEGDLLGGAVTGLAEGIRKKQPWAIQFVLKTKGKRLGWSERTEVVNLEGGKIDVDVHGGLPDRDTTKMPGDDDNKADVIAAALDAPKPDNGG